MTQIEKEKLEGMFHDKYMDLVFSFNGTQKTWRAYLESIQCAQRPAKLIRGEFDSLVEDPSPFGGYIQMSEEMALKILTLGLP